MKRCAKCGQEKPLTEFSVKTANKTDGHRARCRVCEARRNRAYKNANREQIRAKNREWYAANRTREQQRHRMMYLLNPQPRRAAGRKWQHANMVTKRAAMARARARRRHAKGYSYTTAQHIKWRWEMWGNRCWVCGDVATATDHVKPLARGGAHLPCNLRPICRACNTRKFTHWPLQHTGGPLLKATVKEQDLFGEGA